MRHTKALETALFSILFLFLLQSLSDFIAAIYAFGLLVTAFTVQVASVVLLFTPLLLLFFRKALPRPLLLGLAYVAIFSRLLEPMLAPGSRLVVAGVSVGAFLLLFPALLGNDRRVHGWQAGSGLTIALSLSIFFRAANSGLDLSEAGYFQVLSWFLAIIAGILIWRANISPSKTRQEDAPLQASASLDYPLDWLL